MVRKAKAAKVFEGMAHMMPENANASLGIKNPGTKMQTNSACLSTRKKASKNQSMIVRRSERLRNLTSHARNKEREPVIEEINLIESEKEDEPHVEQNSSEPLPCERNLEEKVDYLVEPVIEEINLAESEKEDEPHVEQNSSEPFPCERNLEEKIDYLFQTVEELKSKAAQRYFPNEIKHAHLSYRCLYIESQKKIEALTDENYQLSKKLEFAIAKLDAFENEARNCSKVFEKLKDVILISNLAKTTALNLPSQATSGGFSSLDAAAEPQVSAVKRKRVVAGSKKN